MSDATYHRPDANRLQSLKDLANKLRLHSIEATNASNSGHPTSCCSMAEIMSVLFYHTMRYTVAKPRDPNNDRFILSKGHAAPILYAAWAEAGLFPVTDLQNLRKVNSDLEGHPTPRLNFVDVATGSLGQGLSCAAGMAYTGKYFDKASYRVYCVIGDGESAEGSIWEALAFCSHYKLDNIVAIFDVNRLGQSEPTALQHDTNVYQQRLEAFGWNTFVVDGHDVEAICKALHHASTVKGKPSAIVAKTFKGKGIPGIEDQLNCHGKPVGPTSEAALAAIRSEMKSLSPSWSLQRVIEDAPALHLEELRLSSPPNYKIGEGVASRKAYGTALTKLGHDKRVVALDADVKNSTFSQDFMKVYPERFIECFIAEQNLIGVGIGCGCRDRTIPFISTFSAFLERAHDQIRMGAISQTNANFCGSHCGVSIGSDGPSQMALEDIAMFRCIPGSTVFYPSDAVSTERAVELAANTKGICFIRTSRPADPVLYPNDEQFAIGKCKVLRQSDSDKVTIVASAVTLSESIKAADKLKEEGINVRLVDPFTIKPIDKNGILAAARATGGRIITVEDHYPEGGIGEAVSAALSEEKNITIHKMAVNGVPRSGTPGELLDLFAISCPHIVKAVKSF